VPFEKKYDWNNVQQAWLAWKQGSCGSDSAFARSIDMNFSSLSKHTNKWKLQALMENQATKIIQKVATQHQESMDSDSEDGFDADCDSPATERARKVLEKALRNRKSPNLALKAALEILKGQNKETAASPYSDIPTPALLERMDLLKKRVLGQENSG
jgi:hypothetical protein